MIHFPSWVAYSHFDYQYSLTMFHFDSKVQTSMHIWNSRSYCYSLIFSFNAAACPDPGVPSNGKRLGNNFQEGETVLFKCNRNHSLVGNATIQCGEGGIWSGKVPKCRGSSNWRPLFSLAPRICEVNYKAWKKFWPKWDLNPWPLQCWFRLYQLSYQTNWGVVTLWVHKYTRRRYIASKWLYEISYVYIWTVENDMKLWLIIAFMLTT